MPVYLPKNIKLPPDQEINASLLITKYAHVKTSAEKDESATIARRSCRGRTLEKKRFCFSAVHEAESLFMKLEDRLVVDQSGGVQENANLCLHPHFGVPMIPGSAIKGVARHYLWELWQDAIKYNSIDAAKQFATELIQIFGYPSGDDGKYLKDGKRQIREPNMDDWCQKHLAGLVCDKDGKKMALAGCVAFLPALPVGNAPLEADVLTCHHMDYYSPNQPKKIATDDEAPNPQFFPTVKKGATFEFVVCPTARGSARMVQRARELVKAALECNGIGAKTGAGYGWFSENKELAEKRRAENEKRVAEDMEKARQASLSPVDLAKETLQKSADFGTAVVAVLQSENTVDQRALIQLVKGEQAAYWKELKKRAKKRPKAKVRVDEILSLAQTLGEELI